MNIKEKLEIVIITYNRKDNLENTLEQILSENSPVKNLDITVLDNHSTDGTYELMKDYCSTYNNIRHIVNKVNIGGCANSVKAFVEIPQKEYTWVLCDNDTYDWSNWYEIEDAINKNYEVILTRTCPNTPAGLFYTSTLISAVIIKIIGKKKIE